MTNLGSYVFTFVSSSVLCAALMQPAFADITSAQCEAIRADVGEVSTRWFGLDKAGNLTALNSGDDVSSRAIKKIVYLHARDDENIQATVVAVKITFHTNGNEKDKNIIRVKNGFKNGFSVKFEDYQAFHNGTKEVFKIKNNFHLSSGFWNRRIPFTTFIPLERRSQLTYADTTANDELTFRSYLFTFEGLHPSGSCVDFEPFIPDSTEKLRIEIIDLLDNPEEVIFYHGSLSIGLKE